MAIAQQRGAALFVSMHADALTDHSVRGASVYTLAEHRLGRADGGAGAAGERGRPFRRPRVPRRLAGGRAHPREPGAAGDADRLGAAWRTAWSARWAQDVHVAAEPGPPCRFRGAEGGRHPERAGGNGLHVEPAGRGGVATGAASRPGGDGDAAGDRRLVRAGWRATAGRHANCRLSLRAAASPAAQQPWRARRCLRRGLQNGVTTPA